MYRTKEQKAYIFLMMLSFAAVAYGVFTRNPFTMDFVNSMGIGLILYKLSKVQ